jgi:predicted nucleotidyltransferase
MYLIMSSAGKVFDLKAGVADGPPHCRYDGLNRSARLRNACPMALWTCTYRDMALTAPRATTHSRLPSGTPDTDRLTPHPQTVAIFDGMKQGNLIEVLKTYDAALRENGATAVFVFGSRARGNERADSDLDLFIDYDPTAKIPNMFRLMQIEEKISETLGIPVTITTRDALHPSMKESIERDAVRVT